jgi:hypothetical protein
MRLADATGDAAAVWDIDDVAWATPEDVSKA